MAGLCKVKGVKCQSGAIVFDWPESHLAVPKADGTLVDFGLVFGSQSGAGCDGSPQWSIDGADGLTVVAQFGDAYERESNECHEAGRAFYAAVVDTKTPNVLAEFMCGEQNGRVIVRGRHISYTCGDTALSATLESLRSCNR